MKFNDNQLINDNDVHKMSSSYAKILEKEVEDLREILDKMIIQKNDLIASNSDGKYDQIISKLSSDIDKLNSIITSTQNRTSKSSSGYTLNIPDTLKKTTILDDNSRLSPYRSLDEMSNVSDNNNTPQTDNNLTINPPQSNSKRGRPMQSFSLGNIIKKFALNQKKEDRNLYPLKQNKYHVIITNTCHTLKSLQTNQIDIIRLLLLYLTLRPNCKYTSILSTIANDQFDIFLALNT